jgi:hypothetical protein
VAAITLAVVLLTGGSAGRHAAADSSYGGYPSWLAHTKLPPVNVTLQASLSHPQLDAIEGNRIEVQLPGGGRADITAVGPAFPAWVSADAQAGKLSEGRSVPTTFTVTLEALHGTVPLQASAFSILTATGALVRPAVTMPAGRTAVLRAGQHVSLVVQAQLTEGEGSLRWAPAGPRVLSAWLYQVELD